MLPSVGQKLEKLQRLYVLCRLFKEGVFFLKRYFYLKSSGQKYNLGVYFTQ